MAGLPVSKLCSRGWSAVVWPARPSFGSSGEPGVAYLISLRRSDGHVGNADQVVALRRHRIVNVGMARSCIAGNDRVLQSSTATDTTAAVPAELAAIVLLVDDKRPRRRFVENGAARAVGHRVCRCIVLFETIRVPLVVDAAAAVTAPDWSVDRAARDVQRAPTKFITPPPLPGAELSLSAHSTRCSLPKLIMPPPSLTSALGALPLAIVRPEMVTSVIQLNAEDRASGRPPPAAPHWLLTLAARVR